MLNLVDAVYAEGSCVETDQELVTYLVSAQYLDPT